ncbi:M17 family peptidase N-terminal domain-containing protein, partial [Alcanivorax sp. HI0044]|uniref:M17 family peptidase N-terminal domain-containing protein n=2 Tax=Alcanivorax TaxID=59753 RepID=UPI000AFF4990
MDFAVSNKPLEKSKADALVVLLSKKNDLPEALPDSTREHIAQFMKAGDFSASKGQMSWLHTPAGANAARLLLVGTGDSPLSDQGWLSLVQKTTKALTAAPVKQALWLLDNSLPQTQEWQVREGSRVVEENTYRFDA